MNVLIKFKLMNLNSIYNIKNWFPNFSFMLYAQLNHNEQNKRFSTELNRVTSNSKIRNDLD